MQSDTLPQPVSGPSLAKQRRQVGVAQTDLARRLGMHRVSLSGWERAAFIDPIRAARYERALRELVAEAINGTDA